MKVAFDHQAFLMQAYGGISRYFVRLGQELIAKDNELCVFAPVYRNQYLSSLPDKCVHGRLFNKLPPKSDRMFALLNSYLSGHTVEKYSPSILHETYYAGHPVASHGAARILTVYDMIHERFSSIFPNRDKTSANKLAAVERADHIICISQSTKRDLCEIFNVPPAKVSVVYLGSEKFPPRDSTGERVANERPFLLFVGNRGGYKNFKGMLRALATRHELHNKIDVVTFGGGAFTASEMSLIQSLGFNQDTVHNYSGTDDAVLGQLYQHARALVYPSLYEGFGLPPLEAMAHECPVVSSNSSSMPEVIGQAGEYFAPSDIDDQAQAICKVVFDTSRRDALIQLGKERLEKFSWTRCADQTLDVYKKV